MTQLSESQQDYLKIILNLIRDQRVARIKDIAAKKNVSMPSVTEAMRKLAKEGYIEYSVREFIDLTPEGLKTAAYLLNRSTFLMHFLNDILELDEAQAVSEACALEHHLSPETLEKLSLLYQFITHCPQLDRAVIENFRNCLQNLGDASSLKCDSALCLQRNQFPHFGENDQAKHILLQDLAEDESGTVLLIQPDEQILTKFSNQGIWPGSTLTMVRKSDGTLPFKLTVDGLAIELEPEYAGHIEIALANINEAA